MEKNLNSNNGLKVWLIIFIVLTLILGGYIVYDKVLKKEKTDVPIKEETKQEEKDTLPEWATYVLNQNITSITYKDGTLDENEECTKPKTLTKTQLKSIFEKMTKANLKKYDLGGAGGPCDHELIIKYGNKELSISSARWISISPSNDNEVIKLLEKEQYTYIQPTNDDVWMVFEYEWDTSYINTLVK